MVMLLGIGVFFGKVKVGVVSSSVSKRVEGFVMIRIGWFIIGEGVG